MIINSGERKFLTMLDHSFFQFPYDTVSILFNDSILFKHIELNNNGVIEYIPSEHNMLDYSAWEVDDVKRVATYTITEEDYQRALEQSETLKANLLHGTTEAQIDELVDNYEGFGF